MEDNSILRDVRKAIGLDESTTDYDTDLLMHINGTIGKLNQNGIGNFLVVTNEEQKWIDLKKPEQVEGNRYFQMIPLFIVLSTKMIFDPPPPSTIQHYANNIDQALWRLKVAYEEPVNKEVIL